MSYAPYVSIDIETTGLSPVGCQILEIGMVVEDWRTPVNDLPSLSFLVKPPADIVGEPVAMKMNAGILREIADPEVAKIALFSATGVIHNFLSHYFPISEDRLHFQAAGKNYAGFDRQFLERLPGWHGYFKVHHRALDPGSMYFDPRIDDEVPSTAECLKRAGLDPDVKHRALEDARDVVRLIRFRAAMQVLVDS